MHEELRKWATFWGELSLLILMRKVRAWGVSFQEVYTHHKLLKWTVPFIVAGGGATNLQVAPCQIQGSCSPTGLFLPANRQKRKKQAHNEDLYLPYSLVNPNSSSSISLT